MAGYAARHFLLVALYPTIRYPTFREAFTCSDFTCFDTDQGDDNPGQRKIRETMPKSRPSHFDFVLALLSKYRNNTPTPPSSCQWRNDVDDLPEEANRSETANELAYSTWASKR